MRHRLAHGHAHFQTHHPGQPVGVFPYQLGRAEQYLFPQLVVVDPVLDVLVKGVPGGIDGGADILHRALGGHGSHLPCIGWVFPVENLTAGGLSFFTVDYQIAGQRQLEPVVIR